MRKSTGRQGGLSDGNWRHHRHQACAGAEGAERRRDELSRVLVSLSTLDYLCRFKSQQAYWGLNARCERTPSWHQVTDPPQAVGMQRERLPVNTGQEHASGELRTRGRVMLAKMIECSRCGLEVRRKRVAQRYCSERCRNASVQERKRATSRGHEKRPQAHPVRAASPRRFLTSI